MSCRRVVALALAVGLALAICTSAGYAVSERADEPATITLMTHDSFNVSKPVLRAFTRSTGITVKVLRAGDAGQVLNQAILTKDHPLADVLYGVDNTFLSRALDEEIFEPYSSPALATVPSDYILDESHHATPIDRADVCVNDDKRWFSDHDVPRPTSLEDLTSPEYQGLLVVENPATSSTGLSFMLATIAEFGEERWDYYWARLRANDVLVVAREQGKGGPDRLLPFIAEVVLEVDLAGGLIRVDWGEDY